MSIDKTTGLILQRISTQWNDISATLQRLKAGVSLRPTDVRVVFRPADSTDELVQFDVDPVVLNLTERWNHTNPDLFVVFRGQVGFDRPAFTQRDQLVIRHFATEVAYFRRHANELRHVFGAHYDLAMNEVGHPAFHGQFKSFSQFAEFVKRQYGVDKQVDDCVKGLLKNVRVPTAQMDVFSLILQLCADHLLSAKSSQAEKAAFSQMLTNGSFVGTADKIQRLSAPAAASCYRARHWYPIA
jgi:hypothetical protein